MLTLVGSGPLPPYVQISYWDVPPTTGPVSLCPSAAFTTDAEGHAGREPVPLAGAAAVVVDEEDGVGLDEHAAPSAPDRTIAPATVALRMYVLTIPLSMPDWSR